MVTLDAFRPRRNVRAYSPVTISVGHPTRFAEAGPGEWMDAAAPVAVSRWLGEGQDDPYDG
jgi:hypothetical protein